MKKIIITLFIVILLIGGGVWLWNSSNSTKKSQQTPNNTLNYQSERSNVEIKNESNKKPNLSVATKTETEISTFTTKIYNKDVERQNNIGITCRVLSGKEVQPGETFSFCDIVGKSTTSKGYQEADIYVDGKKEQGLGGGNCQVSTTLYNAVAQVPSLEVVEKHEHSGRVPYVQQGKDAAVAYGNYDFKFKNNTGNVIRIVMENTVDNITAKLIKIDE